MRMKWFKDTLQKVLLVTISVSLTIIAINLLFRVYALHIVNQNIFPRALINYLGDHYHTFYPSVNDKTLKNWNAVLGDSYAAGGGDPYLQNKEMYGWMHFLHKKNNENYYIFGRSGFGSVNSAREFVVTTDEIKNSVFYPKYEPPQKMLFVFYEGNDLNNNLSHFSQRGKGSKSTRDFVENEIRKPVEYTRVNRVNYPVILVLRGIYGDRKKFFTNPQQDNAQAEQGETKNYVIVDEKRYDFSILPQSAAAELDEEQTNLALNLFFDSIRYLKNILPNTKFEIVYLPSVVTVYTWDNPVYFETYHTNKLVSTNYQSNLNKSKYIRNRIIEFSNFEGMAFIDTSEELIANGRNVFLHGPLDWRHFNGIGHQIVGEIIYQKEVALAKKPGR
jgi:hypothetical protein